MNIIKRPAAKQDLIDCGCYIAMDHPPAAERFLDSVEKAFGQLAKMTEIGVALRHANPRLPNLRFWPVAGFRNYLIFYCPLSDGVEIIRVLNGARDWHHILEEG